MVSLCPNCPARVPAAPFSPTLLTATPRSWLWSSELTPEPLQLFLPLSPGFTFDSRYLADGTSLDVVS